jgi:hypothetical protein
VRPCLREKEGKEERKKGKKEGKKSGRDIKGERREEPNGLDNVFKSNFLIHISAAWFFHKN